MQIETQNVTHQWISGRGESYDRLNAARDAILAKIEDGTAKPEDMLSFALLVDDCGYEVIPQSAGMPWIMANPTKFTEIVGDADLFMQAALHAYDTACEQKAAQTDFESPLLSLPHWFFQGFIQSAELLTLLSPQWRERFIHELYPRFGSWNNGWINAAIMAGVTRQVIAQAIIERLRRTQVRHGMANDVHDFIEYGIGDRHSAPIRSTLHSLGIAVSRGSDLYNRILSDPTHGFDLIHQEVLACLTSLKAGDGYTHQNEPFTMNLRKYTETEKWHYCFGDFKPWDMLTNQELSIALAICGSKAPNKLMGARVQMERRLPSAAVDAHIAQAILGLESLDRIPEDELKRLDARTRKALAKRLDLAHTPHYATRHTFSFLLRLVVDLEGEGEAFFREVVAPTLTENTISTAFIAWRRLGLSHPQLEDSLEYRLDQAGYWYGTIEQGRHPKGGTQMLVHHGHLKMVQARGHHRYFPSEGDLVLYRVDGHYLTPRVVAVYFTPIMKDVR